MDMEAMREMMETTSKEERDAGMKEWGEWMKNNMDKFADGGAPTGKNWQVSPGGSKQLSNDVGGYAIVQAESIEEAAKFLETSPHLKMPGATCDVAEIVSMAM
jgi:hypothetical protein